MIGMAAAAILLLILLVFALKTFPEHLETHPSHPWPLQTIPTTYTIWIYPKAQNTKGNATTRNQGPSQAYELLSF